MEDFFKMNFQRNLQKLLEKSKMNIGRNPKRNSWEKFPEETVEVFLEKSFEEFPEES